MHGTKSSWETRQAAKLGLLPTQAAGTGAHGDHTGNEPLWMAVLFLRFMVETQERREIAMLDAVLSWGRTGQRCVVWPRLPVLERGNSSLGSWGAVSRMDDKWLKTNTCPLQSASDILWAEIEWQSFFASGGSVGNLSLMGICLACLLKDR